MKGRISAYVLVPLLTSSFILGAFFTLTNPTTWPDHRIRLMSTDTRLLPVLSTVWCESVVLTSDHDFVVYKTDGVPNTDFHLSKYTLPMIVELNRRHHGLFELRYYLLEGSALSVAACASRPRTYVHIYRGIVDRSCLHPTISPLLDSSDYSDSESEEIFVTRRETFQQYFGGYCSMPLKSVELPTMDGSAEQQPCFKSLPTTVNVNANDVYSILFINKNSRSGKNYIKLEVTLDRTTYNVNKSMDTIQVCAGKTNCNMRLNFLSKERVLVSVPRTSDAGWRIFTIESRCRPRIVVFATVVVVLPIVLFFVVIYMYWKHKDAIKNQAGSDGESRASAWTTASDGTDVNLLVERTSNRPPPYEMINLMCPPPPYSSLTRS